MAGDGYGLPSSAAQAGAGKVGDASTIGNSLVSMQNMGAANSGATGNTQTAAPGSTTTPTQPTPTPLGAPPGLLQADNSGSGFQLAATSQTPGTDIMGTPSWMSDWTKAGNPDMNTWYQQQQGYHDMSQAAPTPAQLQFAPPPPPPAPIAAPAATPAAPAAPQGNWYTPKSGPAPAVTKNSLWGSTPVGQAELDALPDAFVSSQSFLNQYGSSPSAIAYQQWRMGAPAYFGQIASQDRTNTQNLFANVNRGGGG